MSYVNEAGFACIAVIIKYHVKNQCGIEKKVAVSNPVPEFEKLYYVCSVGTNIPLGSFHGYLHMK